MQNRGQGSERKRKMKYTEITDHETACNVLGRDPNDMPVVSEARQSMKAQVEADAKLIDWADAINKADDDFKADFEDKTQWKWRPFFWVDASGLRFDGSGFADSGSSTDVGSRLCFYFRSREAANYFAEKTIDLIKISHYGH